MKVQIDPKFIKIETDFRKVCSKIRKKGREMLADYEITPPQFTALMELIEHGDMTIGELSNKMYLACSTVTDLLDRMERNLLVVRVKDEKDRRIVRIHVLEKGHKLIDEVLYNRRKYLQDILGDMGEEKIDEIERVFDQLNERMYL